ncbi:sensor histidine kinase [Aestuariimicrobium ganziense]|uniref:sensor histidine kinase n=1 Tax=Aestuariimicrobium ganziense TaxID=2773677 RepID=UPI001942FCC5|nr:ATP-binding protein [Aestuariimicrobium ganziense]
MPNSEPQWSSEYRLLRSTYNTLSWLRVALALHAALVNALRWDALVVPGLAGAVMISWSLIMHWMDSRGRGRTVPMLVTEFLLGITLLGLSPVLLSGGGEQLMPITVFWPVISPLALALTFGVRYGILAGALMGMVQFLEQPTRQSPALSAGIGLVLLVWGVGRLVGQLRATIAQRDATLARAAVLAERDRMARIVHDGALQVLSLVEREAPELGPRGARLARLALNQEVQLRAALQDRSVPQAGEEVVNESTEVDVTPMMGAHGSDRVTVSMMAGQVFLPRGKAIELEAAVQQVLLNVRRHAGEEAKAWVLVEETDDELVVSIRDNGVGMSRDELATAMNSNRMGMRASILGRIETLGGKATVKTQPSRGLEWELRVPK